MTTIGIELLFLLILIMASGVFSLAETAIVSSRKARLQQAAEEGNSNARTALQIANAPENFLSTVQIGITLIGILTGTLGGVTFTAKIDIFLSQFSLIEPYSRAIAVSIFVLLTTYLSLVIGELVPKRIALNNPERTASTVAPPMNILTKLTYPVVLFLTKSADWVLHFLGIKPSSEPLVTEEEVKVMLEQGTLSGTFHATEQELIERIFRLGDRKVSQLMTPRTEIVWLDADSPAEELLESIAESTYSFFPVAQGSIENILGIVRAKDVLTYVIQHKELTLTPCLRKPLFIFENAAALKVMEQLKESGMHIALVIDEYGAVQGLVTYNDILQSVFGDVYSDEDSESALAQQRDDGSWLLDGSLPLDELPEVLEVRRLTESERSGLQTLGGFVMTQMHGIPSAGQKFIWEGMRFEVVDMDERRVDKVLVSRV